jgi:two-component system, chemotaxis family, chemotaxis protein CheY
MAASAGTSAREERVSQGKTVLVVDDEPDIRESLRDALEDEGYRVSVARNGKEAFDLLPTLEKPVAIILDIIMPVMSGAEFYAAIHADPRFADTPVLISTSDASRAPSGVLLMKKPIDLDRLLDAVAKLF